ncbi:filamentous hemagglutinin N-terminal domain-containing protein [Achromobacter xylosoxidans]|uniref:hemagglutinin repeat-containing protein n=1 Tax=Alcaligenes xylosoxydans xylosoxydans TaxID=85698 RepID=UPI001232A429|nr:hemagglutinin repeat-containing protein [Achromobacter xylosoxidans]KAA5919639.1 filamentous hemagglutinin N-terminal domain-containing protein [Achromobacter xylosoxidans]
MMSKLRSLIVWSVVFTQFWSPVLAQTLPISVDKSVPGAKPTVGMRNGVPVINIAPPSAGGVSNNRYTQFNVGPSGAVLNNSGGASQTQLAGQVAGNPMLGNRRAGVILNQVTAPNPSQLLGTLEVAGNRANVIVANPAGITCNGCGFLNADRAALTTGKPSVGADGSIGFDVAEGRLKVDGQGLDGMNVSQVDLIARTLEINADVWANRLNVTAGAARVDYGTGAVSAQAGAGAAPAVVLDTAALGGMYADSIRLIGTEAGVGVNIGGNLAALTGDLQVSAAGDVRIAPRATVQAAGNLRVQSGGDVAVQGAAQAAGGVALAAARNVEVQGAVGAGAALNINADGDVAVGAQGSLRTQGALRVTAGRDLAMAGGLLTSGQDALAQSGRNLTVAGQAVAPQPPQGGTRDSEADTGADAGTGSESCKPSGPDTPGGVFTESGVVSAKDDITLHAGRDLVLPRQVYALGTLLIQAGEHLALEEGAQLQSAGNITIQVDQDAALSGAVLSGETLSLTSGNDLAQGSTGKLQGKRVQATAGRDLALGGASVSTVDVQARATRDMRVDGKLDAGGSLGLDAGRDLSLAGTMRGDMGTHLEAGGKMNVSGTAASANGFLNLNAGQDMNLSADSRALAGESLVVQAGGKLLASGTIFGKQDITLRAGTSAELNGETIANGTLRTDAGGDLLIGQMGLAQSSVRLLLGAGQDLRIAGIAGTAKGVEVGLGPDTLQAQAGRDLFITGTATAGSPIILGAQRDIRIDGIVTALEGELTADAGANLAVGATGRAQASESLNARAGADLDADGVIAAGAGLALAASGDVRVGGLAAALGERAAGDVSITARRDIVVKQNGLLQAAGTLTADAQRDLFATGALSSVEDMRLAAARDARVDGTVATDANLTLTGRDVAVGMAGQAQAGRTLNAAASGSLQVAGRLLAGGSQSLTAGGALTLDGTVAALQGDLSLTAQRGDIVLGAASRQQAGANLTVQASGALTALGLAAAEHGMTLYAGADATLGGIAATKAGDLNASADGKLTTTADGRLQSGAALELSAGGALGNAGIVSAARHASLKAGTTLDNTGSVLTGGDLVATTIGKLVNTGRFVAGVDTDGALSESGSLTLRGDTIVHRGASLTGKDLSVSADSLELAGGTLAASDDVAIKLRGQLDNTGGRIAAAGDVHIEAAAIANREGLITADNALTLSTASLDNSDTLTVAGNPSKGVLGKMVAILADRVGNQAGSIQAHENLALTTKDLDNAGGEIASQGNARILADRLDNADGRLLADKSLTVITQVLQGLGTLQSAGDLSFQYAGSLSQEGDIASGRDLALSVGGDMDNRARISAVRDLTITADSLNNQASGELLAGGLNTIRVARGLTNAGLIDGGSTRITANRLDNTGRIYGDTLSIQAGALANGAGPDGGAVIASRGDMNLGVGSLTNRDHALIYSGADLRIGGALDTQGTAIDNAVSLLNASAVIEAVGDADISAASIRNQNDRYASDTARMASKPKVYFRTRNSSVMYDAETNWLCETDRPVCGKDPLTFLENDSNHQFLLPSDKYPASRYGPPFDYAPFVVGDKHGPNVPIAPAVVPLMTVCTSADGSRGCRFAGPSVGAHRTANPTHVYATDAQIWQVFGVQPPEGPMPIWVPEVDCAKNPGMCAQTPVERRRAYEQAFARYQSPFKALNARIREFNQEYKRRLVEGFYYYIVTETVTETRTTTSDPAKILSGGDMTLTGAVTNDKSQIAAGGALSVQGPSIVNIGAAGTRTITRTGTQIFTDEHGRRRRETRSPYNETMAAEPMELPVGTSAGNVRVTHVGSDPGVSSPAAPGPVQVASVPLPGVAVVRSVSKPVTVPDSQLFTVSGKPEAPYIVATDPRFVGQHPFVSSDYLLDLLRRPGASPDTPMGDATADKGPSDARLPDWKALLPAGAGFLTPAGQPRRLGDGFYEQKLVSDQILASSGQRFLKNYSDYDAQYKALMAEGARFAQLTGLKVGLALSEAQQRQLTTDLVWLVEETVTLPDGTTEAVLVPRVYLLVQPTDLKGDGTLMAGRDVTLAAEGDIVNSGTIGARAATVMTAANILNKAGGSIQGSLVDLAARENLNNLASLIKGDAVALSAASDIAFTSATASENFGSTWGTHLSGVASVDAGRLNLQAGRDITLTAAQVSASDDARLQAGRDIRLGMVAQNHGERIVGDARNRHELTSSREVGTTITAGGDMTWIAGQDVDVRGADVTAGKQLTVHAGQDLNVSAGVATGSTYAESYRKKHGFLSSRTSHTISSTAWEQAQASTLTGDTALFTAGRDLNVAGSNVGAQRDLIVSAQRDANILPGANKSDGHDYKMVRKSGFGAMGGLSYGSSKQTDSLDGKKVFHTASTVGSVEVDTLISAGRTLNVVGSNVLARQGDVTLIGREVNIGAARDASREKEFHEVKQSGLTLVASNPIVSAVQTGARMAEASGRTDNAVMKGLAGATAGLAAVNAYDAVRDSAKAAEAAELAKPGSSNPIDKAGGVSIKLSLGASKSRSTTDRNASTAFGSTVAAGHDLTLIATGAGRDSDINLIGSDLSAGNNALLKAEGDILLRAARNATEQKTDSKSSSASIGIGYSTGGQQNGFTLELGASVGRGKADGKDESWAHSHVTAGNVLAIQSGGDTMLKGATGEADQVIALVGGDLLLESLQDGSKYASSNKSAGIGVSLCVPPYCTGSSSVSANASTGAINSDFKSVTEQTGLRAGDGGFQIDVQNNTRLIGSVIASSDRAIADGLNLLTTGTLVTEDIGNRAKYRGSQVSVGGGFGFGGGKGADTGLGTSKDGDVAGGAGKQHGSSIATDGSGFGMGTPVVVAARGSGGSTTQSAVSAGEIVIRDEAAQQDLTGMTAAQTVAALNRDASDTLNALKPIFDKEKIEAGFEIASEASRQVGQFLTNRAREAKELEDALETEAEGPRRVQLEQAYEDAKKWQPGGENRRWLTAIMGAATGNVTGTAGDAIQAAAVNYLQGLGATEVKKLVAQMEPGPGGEAARAALHAIVGCAGAAGTGASCSAGALGAGVGSVLNALLDEDGKKLNPAEKEQRSNLVQSLVAGISTAVGADAVVATHSAASETENNHLTVLQHEARIRESMQCKDAACRDEVRDRYADLSKKQRAELVNCEGSECTQSAQKLAALAASYDARARELLEKSRREGGLSEADREELKAVKGMSLLIQSDHNEVLRHAILSGSEEAKKEAWNSIATEGALGAAAAVGAVRPNKISGNTKAPIGQKGKGSALPAPEPVTASNGLVYESSPKHTPGQTASRPNAGLEPRNSLDLFANSLPGKEGQRFARDAKGNIHRFSDSNNGSWHWSGSTGDKRNILRKDDIPIEIRRFFNFSGKGK